jgi:hypothetical protein
LRLTGIAPERARQELRRCLESIAATHIDKLRRIARRHRIPEIFR